MLKLGTVQVTNRSKLLTFLTVIKYYNIISFTYFLIQGRSSHQSGAYYMQLPSGYVLVMIKIITTLSVAFYFSVCSDGDVVITLSFLFIVNQDVDKYLMFI